MRIVAIGEILWDVFPDSERLGGATFNFAVNAHRLGHEVRFISAVGRDERGLKALAMVRELGLSAEFIRQVDESTGVVTVRVGAGGQPGYVLHRPAAYDAVELSDADLETLAKFSPDWIYFGTLHQILPKPRSVTAKLIASLRMASRFLDVNLRRDCYTKELVTALLVEASVVKMNEDEMRVIEQYLGWPQMDAYEFCRKSAERFGWQAVCVTRGERGCMILQDDNYAEAEGRSVEVADTVGAGDAFAAAFVHGIGLGWPAAKTAAFANRLGALVSSHSGALPDWSLKDISA